MTYKTYQIKFTAAEGHACNMELTANASNIFNTFPTILANLVERYHALGVNYEYDLIGFDEDEKLKFIEQAKREIKW